MILFTSMKLKLIRYILSLTAGFVVLGGCSKEQLLDDEGGYSREMTALTITTRVPVSTENGTSAEDEIQTLRLIAYAYNGTAYRTQQANVYNTATEAAAGNGTYQIRITIPQGIAVRIFVVANEKAEWNLGNQTISAASLQNKVINHLEAESALNIRPPFVMFAESETIESTDYQAQQVSLTRTVAKLSLSLQADFARIAGLNGGNITIEKVELQRLPNTQILVPGFPFSGNESTDLSNTLSQRFFSTPTVDAGNNVIGFTTAADRKLVFYLPEYRITNKAYYSFLKIDGQYTPSGSSTSLPISYQIPVGNGVQQLYEGVNPPTIGQLTTSDLTITRNNHYAFDATIQTLGATDGILLYVKAQPWIEGETVEGGIPEAPYLNVSNITITLTDATPKRIYFWTNQPEKAVGIMTTIKDKNNTVMPLSDIFDATVRFTNTTQTNGYIEIGARTGIPSGNYTIYLNAGGLVRDVQVTIHSALSPSSTVFTHTRLPSKVIAILRTSVTPTARRVAA